MNWNCWKTTPYTRLVLRDTKSFKEKLERAESDRRHGDWEPLPVQWYLEEANWPPKKKYVYGFKNPSFEDGGTVLFVTLRQDLDETTLKLDTTKPVEMILLSETDGRTWAVPVEYAEWFSPV